MACLLTPLLNAQYRFMQVERLSSRTSSEQSLASKWIAILAVVVAAITCSLTAVILVICYSPVPWGDMWDYWAWYQRYQSDWLFHLAAQHNEHRLVVARLFFLFDQFCCSGTASSVAIFIPAIQLLHAIALWRLSLHVPGLHKSTTWYLGAISLAAMFSSQQFANFTWYFQIQFVAVYFGATISCLALMKTTTAISAARSQFVSLGITILLAFATTYSMANGLLIWPILVSLALCFGSPRRHWLTLAAFGVCSWIAYFTGYVRPADHPSPLGALLHLPAFFRFGVTVLGSPFADVISKLSAGAQATFVEDTAALIGVLGLLIALPVFVSQFHARRSRPHYSRAELVYWHLLSFVLLSISLIASGRYTFPVSEALTSRYTTPGLLFWLLLVTLVVIRSASASSRNIRLSGKCLQVVSCIMLLLFVYCDQPAKIAYAEGYQQYLSEAEIAIADNVFDEQAWKRVNHEMTSLLSTSDFLRSENLSVFHKPWRFWIGDPLNRHLLITAPNECVGFIDLVNPVPTRDRPGYKLEGWGWANKNQNAPHNLVLTDENGNVIGGAISGFPRTDVSKAMRDEHALYAGWIGYVSGLHHSNVNAYLLMPGSKACLIGSHPITQTIR